MLSPFASLALCPLLFLLFGLRRWGVKGGSVVLSLHHLFYSIAFPSRSFFSSAFLPAPLVQHSILGPFILIFSSALTHPHSVAPHSLHTSPSLGTLIIPVSLSYVGLFSVPSLLFPCPFSPFHPSSHSCSFPFPSFPFPPSLLLSCLWSSLQVLCTCILLAMSFIAFTLAPLT